MFYTDRGHFTFSYGNTTGLKEGYGSKVAGHQEASSSSPGGPAVDGRVVVVVVGHEVSHVLSGDAVVPFCQHHLSHLCL